MKPAVVRLIGLGIDGWFATSMNFAQATIGSLTVGWEDHPAAEVEYVRTRDWWIVAEALRAPAAVIHVMAHGNDAPEDVSFSSHGGSAVELDELAEYFAEGPPASASFFSGVVGAALSVRARSTTISAAAANSPCVQVRRIWFRARSGADPMRWRAARSVNSWKTE